MAIKKKVKRTIKIDEKVAPGSEDTELVVVMGFGASQVSNPQRKTSHDELLKWEVGRGVPRQLDRFLVREFVGAVQFGGGCLFAG